MPILTLPPGGSALGGGDLPVTDAADVLAAFPETHRQPAVAPIRDAFCESFAEGFYCYQDAAAYAAAQCDPLRATGDYLTALALERGVVRRAGELDEDLRVRLFAAPEIVTPQAIIDAVNTLLAPHTDVECEFIELELDGLFIHDGTVTAWDSFIGASPRHPDRLYYEDIVENDGFYLLNAQPGYAIPSQGLSRNFHLRLPAVLVATDESGFAIDADDEIAPIGDGTDASGSELDGTVATSIFTDEQLADDVYDAIVSTVESIKGQGISWSAEVDELLAAPVAPLSVSSIAPTSGPVAGGTAVTVTGTGFQTGFVVLFINDAEEFAYATSVVVVDSTKITCVTPALPASVAHVRVRTADLSRSASLDYAFTYVA